MPETFSRRSALPSFAGMAVEERCALEARWLELTRALLPAVATLRGWPVRDDHCFQRILLDHACGCCWYDAIAGRPAYRAAGDAVLARAVLLAEQVLGGQADLWALNRQSLAWRGKPKLNSTASLV